MPDSDDFVSPVSPTQSNAQAMLKSFLASILPASVAIVTAQQNRVAEPSSPDFVVMTPIRFTRLRTNIYAFQDAKLFGGISGTVLTVSSLASGTIGVGTTLFGVNVVPGTSIVGLGTLPGLWLVTPAQQVPPGTVMSGGTETRTQGAELVVQLDFHSADTSNAGDMAQTTSTMFRSDYAFEQFANQSPHYDVTPFLADDPRQMPFINESQQYEWRWVVEARMQMNQVVSIAVPAADSVQVPTVILG